VGGQDADLGWPRWTKGINKEPIKVKEGTLTFGTIQSGAVGRLWCRCCKAEIAEGSISSSSNSGTIQDISK
jgi:hypothetical protein